MNVVIFSALLIITLGAAVRYGGGPERWTAGMFVAATLLTYLAYRTAVARFYTVEVRVAAVDLLLLLGLTIVLLKADRFWPIPMFAVHGVTVLTHLVKSFDARIVRHAYAIAIVVPGYVALLLLLTAVVRHRYRLGKHGIDCDWSDLRPLSGTRSA